MTLYTTQGKASQPSARRQVMAGVEPFLRLLPHRPSAADARPPHGLPGGPVSLAAPVPHPPPVPGRTKARAPKETRMRRTITGLLTALLTIGIANAASERGIRSVKLDRSSLNVAAGETRTLTVDYTAAG